MLSDTDLYMNVKRIRIAHEFTLDEVRRCEYPRGRGSYGFVLGLEGEAECRFLTGERVKVSEGDLFFISPTPAYSIVTSRAFRHYTVNFELWEEGSGGGIPIPPHRLLRNASGTEAAHQMRRTVGLWQSKSRGCEMQAVGCLYGLLAFFFTAEESEKSPKAPNRLLAARAYVETHFDAPLTLERLAYLSNMSVTNFRREWKKQYAEPPLQYRDALRLRHAKEQLESGYYTVSEVAEKCGFEDVSYFVRFFRKHTGITPGTFKRGL